MRVPTMLCRLALILFSLALIAGGRLSVQAQAAPQPCPMAMSAGGGDAATPAARPVVPCENDNPARAKQGCSLPSVVLPAPTPRAAPALLGLVRCPPTAPSRGGRHVEPELLPPIPA